MAVLTGEEEELTVYRTGRAMTGEAHGAGNDRNWGCVVLFI